jgi:hypothetical protein
MGAPTNMSKMSQITRQPRWDDKCWRVPHHYVPLVEMTENAYIDIEFGVFITKLHSRQDSPVENQFLFREKIS